MGDFNCALKILLSLWNHNPKRLHFKNRGIDTIDMTGNLIKIDLSLESRFKLSFERFHPRFSGSLGGGVGMR